MSTTLKSKACAWEIIEFGRLTFPGSSATVTPLPRPQLFVFSFQGRAPPWFPTMSIRSPRQSLKLFKEWLFFLHTEFSSWNSAKASSQGSGMGPQCDSGVAIPQLASHSTERPPQKWQQGQGACKLPLVPTPWPQTPRLFQSGRQGILAVLATQFVTGVTDTLSNKAGQWINQNLHPPLLRRSWLVEAGLLIGWRSCLSSFKVSTSVCLPL